MEWTSLNDLREKYLSFFASKGHLRHDSYSLVPEGDKSLLLIVAGMAPLKKYFTGEAEPPRHRMTTCQRCIRTNDIENVGYTARHGTYFEMLGNFSFGDYFKNEALPWAWEFLTSPEWLAIPKDLLYPSVYEKDDEAYSIWRDKIGVPEDHLVRLGKADNFWEHGSGPCGPCSEIYFDRGEKYGCGKPTCGPGCDCDRFMEIWNNVFSQFNNDGNGNYTELAQKNIDTGMGLERLACVMQGVDSMFDVDTIRNIIAAISDKAGVCYHDNEKSDVSLRIIADHMRASSFLIADGVLPSNEGRGYVLRRLLRRACRHGRLLGIKGAFLTDIVKVVARENLSAYPYLTEKLDYVCRIVGMEEERFDATVESGMTLLEKLIADAKETGKTELAGADVFKLSDTYGFPLDLTREIAEEKGLGIDEDGFHRCMDEQKARARAARGNISGWDSDTKSLISDLAKTEFTGYDENESTGKIIAILTDEGSAESVSEGDCTIVLDKTPFYGEGGGQVGDTGMIRTEKALLTVVDTKKTDGVYLHICRVEDGAVSLGETVTAAIDTARREAIRRNHSSAHLLQAALRKVLGTHVEQAGSYVDDKECRFDFSHFAAMTKDELAEVEKIVNLSILAGADVVTTVTDPETAKQSGAMALFGEKYGSKVRMVKMDEFSTELCGGTHVTNTAKIGLFKIISESSVAAGVRRIVGTTGFGVLDLLSSKETLIAETAQVLKSNNAADIAARAAALQQECAAAKKTVESLNAKLASGKLDALVSSAKQVGAVRLLVADMGDTSMDAARSLCDSVKDKYADMVAVFAIHSGDKLNFVGAAGADAVKAGAHTGKLVGGVAAVTGGKGGGRPDSAAAGGRDVSKIAEALAAAESLLAAMC